MAQNPLTNRMDPQYFVNQPAHAPQQARGECSSKKPNMFLDLNPRNAKRPRLTGAPVLSSPDLNKLKLNSPDLESLLYATGMSQTATPTPSATPILFPAPATEEQRNYADGFAKALQELQNSDSSQGGLHNDPMGSCSSSSEMDMMENSQGATFSGSYSGGLIKDEPQTVPSLGSSPPHSPINMESQEKIKLERKRLRNRVAASKCRRRKLERIANLEEKVKMLKVENSDLSTMVNKLKQQVYLLKEQVMDHMKCGCDIRLSHPIVSL